MSLETNNTQIIILKIKEMNTRSKIAVFGMVALSFAFSGNAAAQKMKEKTVMVGGAAMYPSKNIVENAVNSKDHKTLVAAVKAAGLVETLQSDGPFTVFAPTDAAFAKLPAGTVENLVKPENKEMLTNILTYHVLPGKYSSKQVWDAVKAGNGKAMMDTVQGEQLTFWTKGKDLYVTDAKGNKAKVTIADVNQSNGVIHVIDTVLLP
ncbi:Immunogenic protein MPT70 precursor [Chryseobacterium taihuense]|uniref:Immunogenic protein MPT70 n=2 Tax=Chryseobacterium taihuense TaxID=1141221 RepID=A0A4U8WF23_9FLAO|nr:Immunogenic protein MPT70 precursor [Chryseobacterium taihuense]